ncbi:MAG: FtsW/RodA/SpoVE family cell cycle protein [Bacteroidota bacterium]
MTESLRRNHVDLTLLVAVLALMMASLGVVYSASSAWAAERFGGRESLIESHILRVLAGFAALLLFTLRDYHWYEKYSRRVLLGALVLLVATKALGGEVKGSARWFLGFQPSEFAKYALILHLAHLLAVKQEAVRDLKEGFLPLALWIAAVMALVLVQPNFSTGAMILGSSAVLVFVGRARASHMALACAGAVPVLGVYLVSAKYRLARLTEFLSGSPEASSAYQLYQGLLGFGSGGLSGVGAGLSRQRDLYLPESYGDFIFAIVGEEYGLLGTLFILGLFLLVMIRGMRIARHAPDPFGRYLATGITTVLVLYALAHAGVTLGMLPTTGLPMPFVSYGGSSMLFSCMAVGVLLNISSHTGLYPRLAEVTPERESPPEEGGA